MKRATTAGLFWCFLLVGVSISAQMRSETQVDVVQGRLDRVSGKVIADPNTEGRAWWSPENGGAAWMRWHDLQIGPLEPAAGQEGGRAWGPATRVGSGHWGVAYDASPVGLWAVQKPTTYELGLQGSLQGGGFAAAAGGDRRWALNPQPRDSLWTDEARAGLGWKGYGVDTGAEWDGRWEEGGERSGGVQNAVRGRLEVDLGPWVARTRVRWVEQDPWELDISGGWEKGGQRLLVGWDRLKGARTTAATEFRALGLVWGAQASARWRHGAVSGEGGTSVADRAGGWSFGWNARPVSEGVQNRFEASWKMTGWESQASWSVTGRPLGWYGAGSKFELTLRWLSP